MPWKDDVPPPLTGERAVRCRELYLSGLSLRRVAKEVGTRVDRVQVTLRSLGVSARGPWDDSRTEEAVRLFDSGMNMGEIVAAMKASPCNVRESLTKHGRNTKRCMGKKRVFSESEIQSACELYEKRVPKKLIAKALGTGPRQVERLLVDAGVDMRPNGWNSHGATNPAWKGGKTTDKHGYVLIHLPSHPCSNRHGYIREHRLVMEEMIGRPLDSDEVVHHKNGQKDDNRPENLELFDSNAEHLRYELKGKVPNWTESGRKRISEGARQVRLRESIARQSKTDAAE